MKTKEEQIKILLYGNPLKYACQCLNVKDMSKNDYSEVFDVKLDEIFNYVKINGLVRLKCFSRNSLSDGFKFYDEDGIWYTCFLERGIIFDDKVFTEYEEGLKYIVEVLVKLSGTGIYS